MHWTKKRSQESSKLDFNPLREEKNVLMEEEKPTMEEIPDMMAENVGEESRPMVAVTSALPATGEPTPKMVYTPEATK